MTYINREEQRQIEKWTKSEHWNDEWDAVSASGNRVLIREITSIYASRLFTASAWVDGKWKTLATRAKAEKINELLAKN